MREDVDIREHDVGVVELDCVWTDGRTGVSVARGARSTNSDERGPGLLRSYVREREERRKGTELNRRSAK